jgi:molybdenum cofactor biosynthesis protein B
MGAGEHRRAAEQAPVAFHIIVVSTSRTELSDRSGPLIQELLEGAGHRVLGRDILPDCQATVRARLEALRGEARAEAVILSGGTGLSLRDRTYEAVVDMLDKELVGFGELFRRLSYDEIGSAAIMSRATAGLAGRLFLFALPGSPKACRLAIQAIILPEIHHMLYELRKEAAPEPEQPGPLVERPEPRRRLVVDVQEPSEASEPEEEQPELAPWQRAAAELDPAWTRGGHPSLPPPLASNDALRNVLDGATQRGSLMVGDERWGLYGFPDLLRPASKVLLVGPGEPHGCVVALHRHPGRVGTLLRRGQALPAWPNTGNDPARVGQEITGQPYPGAGRLFAIEADRILVLEGDRVRSWDGRRDRDEGSPATALASLALRWSQR